MTKKERSDERAESRLWNHAAGYEVTALSTPVDALFVFLLVSQVLTWLEFTHIGDWRHGS